MSTNMTGTYSAKACGEVVLGTSSQKGTPFIEFYLQITKGAAEFVGKRVRYTGYFTDKTQERTVQSLDYCGFKGEDLGVFADRGLHGLDANEVEIVVEMEEYTASDGTEKEAPRVQWINRTGGFLNVQSAMSADKAAAFGDKMKGILLKTRSKDKGAPATPDAAPASAKDDAPF